MFCQQKESNENCSLFKKVMNTYQFPSSGVISVTELSDEGAT